VHAEVDVEISRRTLEDDLLPVCDIPEGEEILVDIVVCMFRTSDFASSYAAENEYTL